MALLVDVFGFAGYRWTTKSVEQQGSGEFQLNLALHVEARGTRTIQDEHMIIDDEHRCVHSL